MSRLFKGSYAKITAVIVTAGLVSLSVLIGVIYMVTNNQSPEPKPAETTAQAPEGDSNDSSTARDSVTQDAALSALQAVLYELNKADKPSKEFIAELDAGDTSNVPDSVKSSIYLSSSIDPALFSVDAIGQKVGIEQSIKVPTYQALLTLARVIDNSGKNSNIEPEESAAESVYLNDKNRTALIPVKLFGSPGNVFNVQMVYVDGKWMIDPLTLLAEVRISVLASQSAAR